MTNELFLDVVNFLRRPISQNEGAASLGTPLIRIRRIVCCRRADSRTGDNSVGMAYGSVLTEGPLHPSCLRNFRM